jgi:hypothetical protein
MGLDKLNPVQGATEVPGLIRPIGNGDGSEVPMSNGRRTIVICSILDRSLAAQLRTHEQQSVEERDLSYLEVKR